MLLDSVAPNGVRLSTLEVTFPRFVLAEFNTHRQFCLDGETKLYFDLPAKAQRGATQRFTLSVRELFDKWHHGAASRPNRSKSKSGANLNPHREYTARELATAVGYADYTGIDLLSRRVGMNRIITPGQPYRLKGLEFIKWAENPGRNRQPLRNRLTSMRLRSCNEDTGEIYHTRVRDVTFSGRKPVFRVALKNGQRILTSKEHRFLTKQGWQSLEEAVGLKLSVGKIATWERLAEFAVNGIEAYRDPHTVWQLPHALPPWNQGRRYSNLTTRGQPGKARVRRGAESHLWRGGMTPERKRIAAWTVGRAFRTHRANGFKCVLCGSGRELHAHHLDPVAHNADRAYDPTNLTTLCSSCHKELHQRNIELALLEHVQTGMPFETFWPSIGGLRLRKPFVPKKKRAMVRHFVELESVEYVGERDTYDLEVEGPYHNFVADGFIVHNSRNSASSRAVPTSKLIERVECDPVVPLEWGRNKAGMSAEEILSDAEARAAETEWLRARDDAVRHAKALLDLKVHKQELNRILEPFLWHTVVVTATEWQNFFELRCAPNAQPEIRAAALRMRDAIAASQPQTVAVGEWHTPLIQHDEIGLDLETRKRISAARCARVSYLTHEGKRELAKDLELYERLRADRHLSPFEHVATPASDGAFQANFRGWIQMRAEVERIGAVAG